MWGFCKKKYFYFHCQHDEWYINGGNMVLSYFDPLSSWRHGGWILWVESHHDYNHDYDQHHHDWQGPRCHGEEPGSPHARRRVHPAMRQVSCHRILGWFFKCILSLLITQYLCIWSLALLIAKFFSFLSKVVTCTWLQCRPREVCWSSPFLASVELLCQVNNLSLGKKPKNYLPESNENDFNSLKLKRGGEATTLHDNEGEKGGGGYTLKMIT